MAAPRLMASAGGGGGAAAASSGLSMGASGYAMAGIAAFQVWSGLQQAQMIRAQGKINEHIANVNAKYIEKEAWEAEQFGFTVSARYQANVDQVLADQRTVFEASGIDPDSGTAGELVEETKLNAFLNTLDIQKQARKRALGLKFQASNVRLGAFSSQLQSEINASATERTAIINAANTGLSGYLRSNG